MYLEPIFSSDDIHKQLPKEGEMFDSIDTLWCETLKSVNDEPNILDLLEREHIKLNFDEANKKLEKIQKSLNEYLEQKRLVFPRFYFLANEDLLMILAETKNPHKVQPHMDKCFEGIQKVIFSAKDEVEGMVSAEDERVSFDKPIDVNDGERKGNIEIWMGDIEK